MKTPTRKIATRMISTGQFPPGKFPPRIFPTQKISTQENSHPANSPHYQSDGSSIHQNATKNILESNWIIFSHHKLNSSNVFKFHTR